MNSLKRILEKPGIHPFLLPVFFILHSYMQYYGLVSGRVAITMLGTIELIFLGCFLVIWLLNRNIHKTAHIITTCGIVALFFGVARDFISHTLRLPFLAKYIVLLPAILIITIIMVVVISRKKDFRKSNFFLNLLFIIFIVTDGILFFQAENVSFLQQNLLVDKNRLDTHPATASPAAPDVYYLLFDCYPGTAFLQNFMGYDNSALNDSLQDKGFHIIGHPVSNYNRTAFSMAATLNFEYLKGIRNHVRIDAKQYNQATLTIMHAAVPEYFSRQGYDVYNLSIFDIDKQPAILRETFLNLPDKNMLLYNTLSERIKRDIGWNFAIGWTKFRGTVIDTIAIPAEVTALNIEKRGYNHTVTDSLAKIPSQKTARPKFVYAHFYLPHPPFFYDKDGKANDLNLVLMQRSITDKELFLSYLQYTNKVMLSLTNRILKDSRRPPVIIIQSDHGFRDFKGGPSTPYLYFKNYSAFYFPDRDYSMLYDTMSNINTFPVLFNKYFNTRIGLQQDTSVFLAY